MNNKKYKIAVFYIATGDYKKLFADFLESLQNFFPMYEKRVKLISDGLEEYESYEKGNVKVDLCPRINDYPWPIIALYKMWHIFENFDFSCDFSCYFNGNAIIFNHDNDVFDFERVTVSYHSFNSKKFAYNPWPYINISPQSCAYLENETYEYVQSCFFFGPSTMIYEMCQEVNQMLKNDMSLGFFAQWHDESYLNKWCVLHSDFVSRQYVMTVYREDVDSYRFVYLRDKREFFINRF